MYPATIALMKDAVDQHRGPLNQQLQNSRERLNLIIACTPTGEARNLWADAHLSVLLAEQSMHKAIKATLKLLD